MSIGHIALHNEKADHPYMGESIRDSLATYLRSMSIDNFAISGDIVRIGRAHWSASVCRCGDPACDGWSLEPLFLSATGANMPQAALMSRPLAESRPTVG